MNLSKGLRELTPDPRDGMLGELVVYPKLSELPESFTIVPLESITILDQVSDGNDDFCGSYAACGISALQEGTTLYPPFSFAASKYLSGDPDSWGQNQRDSFKAHQKFGALAEKDIPAEDAFLTAKERRRFAKFSLLSKSRALEHLKEAYVQTKGPYDAYDNIRCALWMYREEKRAVGIGVEFGWPLDTYILSGTPPGFGHAMYVVGWEPRGLIAVNSAGKGAGKDGFHLIPRDTIEAYVRRYGAFMFIDMDPEDVKKRVEMQKGLLEWLVTLYNRVISLLLQLPPRVVPPPPPTPTITLNPMPPPPIRPIEDKIKIWCEAIKTFEGYYEGSRSFRNHNPGNLKESPFASGKDKDGFCTFPDYPTGMKALRHQLEIACNGKSKVYNPDMNLYDFFKLYAPDNWKRYAEFVAQKLKVIPLIKIKELL